VRAPPPAAGKGRQAPRGAPGPHDVDAVVAALRQPAAKAAPKPPAAARKPAAKAPASRSGPPPTPLFLLDDDRPTAIAKSPGDVAELLTLACDFEWLVRISYVNGKGHESHLNAAVLDVGPAKMVVDVLPGWGSRTLNVSRVQWARVLTEAEEDQFL